MNMGTHEYGRDPHLPEDMEAQRARARQATVPTLGELIASSDMVTGPDGALLPASVAARGDAGCDGGSL